MKKLLLIFCIALCTSASKAQLNADFSWCPVFDSTLQLCCIQFQNLSTDTGGTIINYYYIFGDGQQGTTMNPQHCYVQLATYIVYLLVTDNFGNVDTAIQTITISHLDSTGCHCNSIGVNDLPDSKFQIQISPNPFHDVVVIFAQFPVRNAQLKIYNCLGALVREVSLSFGEGRGEVNRNGLPDGLYFYELTSNNYELIGNGKFVIN